VALGSLELWQVRSSRILTLVARSASLPPSLFPPEVDRTEARIASSSSSLVVGLGVFWAAALSWGGETTILAVILNRDLRYSRS